MHTTCRLVRRASRIARGGAPGAAPPGAAGWTPWRLHRHQSQDQRSSGRQSSRSRSAHEPRLSAAKTEGPRRSAGPPGSRGTMVGSLGRPRTLRCSHLRSSTTPPGRPTRRRSPRESAWDARTTRGTPAMTRLSPRRDRSAFTAPRCTARRPNTSVRRSDPGRAAHCCVASSAVAFRIQTMWTRSRTSPVSAGRS